MKVLKLILLSMVVLISTSFIPSSHVIDDIVTNKTTLQQSYDVQTYIPWKVSGSGYWSKSTNYQIYNDFDFMVTRSIYPNNGGYYYYDFWFFSQSYYWDGYSQSYTSTNLKNVNIYVNNQLVVSDYSSVGITFNKTFNATSLRIMSKSTQPQIYIKWGSMKAK
jgi:hypothetical protein